MSDALTWSVRAGERNGDVGAATSDRRAAHAGCAPHPLTSGGQRLACGQGVASRCSCGDRAVCARCRTGESCVLAARIGGAILCFPARGGSRYQCGGHGQRSEQPSGRPSQRPPRRGRGGRACGVLDRALRALLRHRHSPATTRDRGSGQDARVRDARRGRLGRRRRTAAQEDVGAAARERLAPRPGPSHHGDASVAGRPPPCDPAQGGGSRSRGAASRARGRNTTRDFHGRRRDVRTPPTPTRERRAVPPDTRRDHQRSLEPTGRPGGSARARVGGQSSRRGGQPPDRPLARAGARGGNEHRTWRDDA